MMLPEGQAQANYYSNKVFFAREEASIAFDAISIERKAIAVLNAGNSNLYLGGENISSENYIEKIPPGKVMLSDKFSEGAIYCIYESGMIMINGSEYY